MNIWHIINKPSPYRLINWFRNEKGNLVDVSMDIMNCIKYIVSNNIYAIKNNVNKRMLSFDLFEQFQRGRGWMVARNNELVAETVIFNPKY